MLTRSLLGAGAAALPSDTAIPDLLARSTQQALPFRSSALRIQAHDAGQMLSSCDPFMHAGSPSPCCAASRRGSGRPARLAMTRSWAWWPAASEARGMCMFPPGWRSQWLCQQLPPLAAPPPPSWVPPCNAAMHQARPCTEVRQGTHAGAAAGPGPAALTGGCAPPGHAGRSWRTGWAWRRMPRGTA